MICQFCGSRTVYIVDSRYHDHGNYHRRRYRCANCCGRFSTYETTTRPYVPRAQPRRQRAPASPADPKREALRLQARQQARETGESLDELYKRWGVA